MIISSMTDGIMMNELDRLLRRIESTAVELGCRIGEFQSFAQTSAGQAMMAQRAESYRQTTPSEGTVDGTDFDGSQEN
ncbi:unnamed protein product [Fusarium equiseti]|uniref:Uncharacterized protein n=1 Tax=Fusarium equiseti TaxID=61235 RepID=A0A8J2IQR5_FUSEQ|nr:unnamed protein product [Fusarium equiseti]